VLLETRRVSAELGGRLVLREVDLQVRAGEVVALVGPNGAGKSTLLNVIAGDVGCLRGAVIVDGQPLRSWSPVELALRRAVLPQQVTVSFPFTVADVVRMGRSPWAGTPHEDRDEEIVAQTLVLAEVAAFAERQFLSLSGGERARVALARVLAQDTRLLLLDEPTAALDIRHQELVLRLLRGRAASGHGAVVVLHDLALAAAHAHRVVVMAGGRVVADGRPSDVLTGQLLSEVYEHEIEVMPHPRGGHPLVLPVRQEDSAIPRDGDPPPPSTHLVSANHRADAAPDARPPR
jgi:iron complex transport system ATP-binding protein